MDTQKNDKKKLRYELKGKHTIPPPSPPPFYLSDIPLVHHYLSTTGIQQKKFKKQTKTIQNQTKITKKSNKKNNKKQLRQLHPRLSLAMSFLQKLQNYQKTQSSPYLEYEEGFARRLKSLFGHCEGGLELT